MTSLSANWANHPSQRLCSGEITHVQQLYPLIKRMYDNGELRPHGAVLAIANACLPAEDMNTLGKGFHCDSFAHFAMIRAEEADIETVFIGFNTWWSVHEDVCPSVNGRCVSRISPEEAANRFLQELSDASSGCDRMENA